MAKTLASFSAYFVIFMIIETSQSLQIDVLNGTTTIKTYQDTSAVVHRRSYNMPFYGDIFGTLVYANPRNACSPVSEATSTNLIAFVPNYDDCIGQNALNIYDAGFSMMLTYSNGSKKIQEYTDLPQARVNQEFATYLVDNIVVNENETNDDIQLLISEDFMAFYEKLLIICGLVLLCAIMLAILIFFCTCCCRLGVRKWHRRGLTVWRIRQLPRRRYFKGKESMEMCSICLEDFEEREYLRVLPCDHVFHPSCVDEWLKNWNRVCPLCKASISRSRDHREQEPLLSNDLASGDSATYGTVRLSAANIEIEPESEGESDSSITSSDDNSRRNAVSV